MPPAPSELNAQKGKRHYNLLIPSIFEQLLLVIFLFFSFNTSTRFIHGLIGPSELAMIALMLVTMSRWRQWKWHRGAMACWAVFMLALACGWALNPEPNPAAGHNTGAFFYCMAISVFLLAYLAAQDHLRLRRLIGWFVLLVMATLTLAFVLFITNRFDWMQALGMNLAIPQRLSLWADNPNQLAFAMVPLPIMVLWVIGDKALKYSHVSMIFFGLGMFFLMGLFIGSDALFLSWLTMMITLFLANNFMKTGVRRTYTVMLVGALSAAFLIFKLLTSPTFTENQASAVKLELIPSQTHAKAQIAGEISGHRDIQPKTELAKTGLSVIEAKQTAVAISAKRSQDSLFGVGFGDNKTSVRSALWNNSIKVSSHEFIVGHGPGAFSWIDDPMQPMEAHNTMLDLLNQVGLLGLVASIIPIVVIWRRCCAQRDALGLSLLAALLVFSVPHFVFRMPMLWVCLALIYVMAPRNSSVAR